MRFFEMEWRPVVTEGPGLVGEIAFVWSPKRGWVLIDPFELLDSATEMSASDFRESFGDLPALLKNPSAPADAA